MGGHTSNNDLIFSRKRTLFELWIVPHHRYKRKEEIAYDFGIPHNALSTILKNHTSMEATILKNHTSMGAKEAC
jgi:hypothetical protein